MDDVGLGEQPGQDGADRGVDLDEPWAPPVMSTVGNEETRDSAGGLGQGSVGMRARYLHVPDAMLKDVARKIADAIRGPSGSAVDKNQDNEV